MSVTLDMVLDLIDALEQQLLTINEDTVHDLLLEQTLNEALKRHGETALRSTAGVLLLEVALKVHDRAPGVALVLNAMPAFGNRDVDAAHAAAVEGAALVTGGDAKQTVTELFATADRYRWDAYGLLMGASVVANLLSSHESPMPDDMDRGWAEAFVAELRAEARAA
jgi:hypothetical protein